MITSELDLFNYLKDKYDNSLNRSEGIYDSYDCYTKLFFIELKCRNWHYDKLIIEKVKYDRLLSESARMGKTPIYINSTPKGIFGFKICEIPIEWSQRDLPRTTDFNDKKLISKTIGYLDIKFSVYL